MSWWGVTISYVSLTPITYRQADQLPFRSSNEDTSGFGNDILDKTGPETPL